MNCYICLLETGCESRPALAICQHCGAGMCREHIIESIVPQMSLGSRSTLMCSRCYASPVQPAKPTGSWKQARELDGHTRTSTWNWLRRLRKSELPEPEEAVVAVERFLNHRRSQ